MKATRREFVKTGVVGTAAVVAAAHAQQSVAGRNPPNILVIMTDQHSKHFLGCYGNDLVRTPHLDRLASEGMRFDSAYCPSPLCVPSRMSFMTGRYPSNNRVWRNQGILNSAITTWAHALGCSDYETSLIGRMHFMGPDQRHGFENRPIGEYGAGWPGVPRKCAVPIRSPYYHGGSGQTRTAVTEAGRGTTTYQYMDEQIIPAACRYLEEHVGDRQRPFAAVVGLVLPHCPYIAPKELFDDYFKRVDVPEVESNLPQTIKRFQRLRKIEKPLTEHQIRVARAAYYGLCEHVDHLIGQLLATLDETNLARDTLVIYTSDHGEMAGEHACWWKSNYYEGSAGVPLIARWPGVTPAGTVSSAVCNLIDLAPTFAEVAGAPEPPGTDGRSLLPVFKGHLPADWPNETFSELCACKEGRYYPSRMIRSGKWKLWYYDDEDNLPPALFDLEADPGETNDLGQDSAMAETRERLMKRLLEGWSPDIVREGTKQNQEDYAALAQWGRTTQPPCPDMMEVPPPSYEDQVELL
jgi:choline-sulfatase